MHTHHNARLTPDGRERLIDQHLDQGSGLAELAAENGVSERCPDGGLSISSGDCRRPSTSGSKRTSPPEPIAALAQWRRASSPAWKRAGAAQELPHPLAHLE
jgi:hypothetical protein